MPRIASITSQTLAGIATPLEAAYNSLAFTRRSYNEGNTMIATLRTRNIPNGTTVNYTVTGMTIGDLSAGSLTGTLIISGNSAFATWTLSNDTLTEGTDTFTLTLAGIDSIGTVTGSLSDSVSVIDTSNTQGITPWLDNNDSIITVRSIISPIAMQINGVFATNPLVPIIIQGRTSGAQTTITNIAANTGSILEIDDDGNSTSFVVDEELNLVSAISYTVTPAANNVNEGSTLIFLVNTILVPDTTTLYWTVQTGAADFSITSGSFGISGDSGNFTVSPTADFATEGAETFTVSIRTDSISGPVVATSSEITINDTSVPTYDTFVLDAASYDEGDTVTVSITSTNIPQNTTVNYTITGVAEGDVSKTTGTITVGQDGTGSDIFTITADDTAEGAETLTVTLAATDSSGTSTGSLSDSATVNDTSFGEAWSKLVKLGPDNPSTVADEFGRYLDVDGSIMVVGDYSDDELPQNSGAAYTYIKSGGTWTRTQRIQSSDIDVGDQFGRGVAVSGNSILVGSPAYDGRLNISGTEIAGDNTGAAYVFVTTDGGSTWTQQAKLQQIWTSGAGGAAPNDAFSQSVDIDGDTAVCGIGLGGGINRYGEIAVFTRTDSTWTQQAVIQNPDGSTYNNARMGANSVKVSGDIMIATAIDNVNNPRIYAWNRSGDTWTHRQTFTDGQPLFFGGNTDLSGDTLIYSDPTSAFGPVANVGAVYIYVTADGGDSWTLQQTIQGTTENQEFGLATSISGDLAAISDANATVHIYTRSGSTWSLQTTGLVADDSESDAEQFGTTIKIDGDTLAVGDGSGGPGFFKDGGLVFVYEQNPLHPNAV
jgi:hypothetical protein